MKAGRGHTWAGRSEYSLTISRLTDRRLNVLGKFLDHDFVSRLVAIARSAAVAAVAAIVAAVMMAAAGLAALEIIPDTGGRLVKRVEILRHASAVQVALRPDTRLGGREELECLAAAALLETVLETAEQVDGLATRLGNGRVIMFSLSGGRSC